MTTGDGSGDEPVGTAAIESVVLTFEQFYEREYAKAVRFAYLLTRDERDAEDLAQDAFVAASRKWSRLAEYDRPNHWIRRVISNRANSRLRRVYSHSRAMSRLQGEVTFAVELSEDNRHVIDALRALPTRQATVLALVYLEDRSLDEAARVLGCSAETARTHRRRGEERLRKILEEAGASA